MSQSLAFGLATALCLLASTLLPNDAERWLWFMAGMATGANGFMALWFLRRGK